MATVIEHDTPSDASTLDVSVGRRRFPSRWNGLPETATTASHPLRENAADVDLPQQLGEAIWKQLPWVASPANRADRASLVETYIRSVAVLERYRTEVGQLIRAACVANIEFRQAVGETHQGARDAAVQKKIDEMLERVGSRWKPIRNVADAKLASQSTDVLGETFQQALEGAVDEFAREFFEMLARLVDRQLFGLVEWLPNQCCRYHFFRQVLIQENNGVSTSVHEAYFEDLPDRDPATGDRIIGRRTYQSVLRGKHYHRLARHQHDVMNSIRTAVGNSRVVMPPAVVSLVKAIPAWLLPLVQVIDGEIFRERIVEKDTRVEDWSQVTVRDEPIVGCEPGVIIGPYVLTGWGPREVQAELDRRRLADEASAKESAVAEAKWHAPILAAVSGLATLVTLALEIQTVRGQGSWFLVVIGILAAIGLYWQSAHDHYMARRDPSARHLACCYAFAHGGLLLLAVWSVARFLTPVTWLIPLFLIVIVGTAYAFAREFRAR